MALYTKKLIMSTFQEMQEELPFNKITVAALVKRAGISPNTFYYHYQDIPALLEEICQIQVDELVNKYPEFNSVEECLDAAMQIVMDNKRAVMRLCIFIIQIIAIPMSVPSGACAKRP